MLTLFDYLPSGNAYKVRLLFAHLGLDYRRVDMDLMAGATQNEAFLKTTPEGRVPTVVTEAGVVLVESNAILCHFADGTPYLPEGRLARTRTFQWLFFEQNQIETTLAEARFQIHILRQREELRPQWSHRKPRGLRALRVMEHYLEDADFFVENRYSIADMSLFAYTHVAEEGEYRLEPFPKIRGWLDRVRNQPGFIAMDVATGS